VTAAPSPARHVRLPDGRSLCYAEFGDPGGVPVFYFHGFPGSRLEAQLVHPVAAQGGARVLAVDRPGFGRSEFLAGRTFAGWPRDVDALADALGLEAFSVLGVSGGAPYALACARFLGERLHAVGVASGMGPVTGRDRLEGMLRLNRLGLRLGRRAGWLSPLIFATIAPVFRTMPGRVVAHLAARAAPPDREFFENPRCRTVFREALREAFRRGSRGPAHEALLYCRPWDFRLEDIGVQVHLWHGERDRIVPPALGRNVAKALPDCRACFHSGDGHFSVPIRRAEEILSVLALRRD
jgi:pimeloyl-ACP methyl ester carboxylesterase